MTGHGKLAGAPLRELEPGLGYVASPAIKTRQELLQKREERRKSDLTKHAAKDEGATKKNGEAPLGILKQQENRVIQRDEAMTNFIHQASAAKPPRGSKITSLKELKE